jgi:hypothetical protein
VEAPPPQVRPGVVIPKLVEAYAADVAKDVAVPLEERIAVVLAPEESVLRLDPDPSTRMDRATALPARAVDRAAPTGGWGQLGRGRGRGRGPALAAAPAPDLPPATWDKPPERPTALQRRYRATATKPLAAACPQALGQREDALSTRPTAPWRRRRSL